MDISTTLCKSCGGIISFEAKECPRCADPDPMNKKAIKFIARKLKIEYNILYIFLLFFLSFFGIMILAIFTQYFGVKHWYMFFVIPMVIGLIFLAIDIVTDFKLKKYMNKISNLDDSFFIQDRTKLSKMIKVSLEKFIEANCKELKKQYHTSKDNHLAYWYILDIYVKNINITDVITKLDILKLSIYDIENLINDKIKSCKEIN